MSLFKYYLHLKTGKYLYTDILYFILWVAVIVLEITLFLSGDYQHLPDDYLLYGVQNRLNFRQIVIPFVTALILVPLLGLKFPQLFFVKSPVNFFKIQNLYYFCINIGSLILGFLICYFMYGKTSLNFSALLFFLAGSYLMYKLIYLFYIVSNNKIIAYILAYSYFSLELYLQKYHINLLLHHCIIRSEKNNLGDSGFNNLVFLICFYGILEVLTRWTLKRKNFLATIVG